VKNVSKLCAIPLAWIQEDNGSKVQFLLSRQLLSALLVYAMLPKTRAPARIAAPAVCTSIFVGAWLLIYVLATNVLHSWLDTQRAQYEIGSALSQTGQSLVEMLIAASEEMRASVEFAGCNQHMGDASGDLQTVRSAQALTDGAVIKFQRVLADEGTFQHLEADQVEGSLGAIDAIADLRTKCLDEKSWQVLDDACQRGLADSTIEAAVTSLVVDSGCERAWSASVLDPIWVGLLSIGATTREPGGFQPSTYIAPTFLFSAVINVITTLSSWHYTNDFTKAGAAATHVLTVSLRSYLELFEAALRSVLAISSVESRLMHEAEQSTVEGMGFVWIMNITQLVTIAATDSTAFMKSPINVPPDWYPRLSDLIKSLIVLQRSAHTDYKVKVLDVLESDINEIASLLYALHIATALSCGLILIAGIYLYRVNAARWTSGHQLLVQTLSMLKPPLRVMQLFLKNLQTNLPNSVRDDAKFRQTAHSIATALDSLSSAVSTGLKNSYNILADKDIARSRKKTVDLQFEIPALLSRYQMLRDVRIELRLFRSIPTHVDIDAETLTIVLSGCISHMLQSVMPQGAINIAARAVINDDDFTNTGRCSGLFSKNSKRQRAVHAAPDAKLVFTLSLGTPSQSGKPYRALESSARPSIVQRQRHSSLNYLNGLVQHGLRGSMGAVVDVAHSSAPVIGVWFSVLAEGALPSTEPGFDIAVINSAVRSGTAAQGLSVVAEEGTADGNAEVSIASTDEIVLLCHSAEQYAAWKRHCEGLYSIVNVPCNTPATFPLQWREHRHILADVKAIILAVDDTDLDHAKQAVAAARASGWLPSIVGVVQSGDVSTANMLPGLTGVIELKNMGRQLEWFIDSVRRVSSRTIRTSAATSSSGHEESEASVGTSSRPASHRRHSSTTLAQKCG